jgi:hypothetical protein
MYIFAHTRNGKRVPESCSKGLQFGIKCVASTEYHLRQAELAVRLALAEAEPAKALALQLLALEHYDKAEKAKEITAGVQLPSSERHPGRLGGPTGLPKRSGIISNTPRP